MVLGSSNPIKNTKIAQQICEENSWDYDIIGPLPYKELIQKMSEYSEVLFIPGVFETFNRFLVEAKMLGCKIKTTNKNGCTSEPWFKDLSGLDLVDFIRSSKEPFISKFIDPEYIDVDYGTQNHFKIVIPLYNTSEWIDTCIDSVKNQNYTNYQCIIVDDRSVDDSVSIIKEKIKDDSRFLLVENTEKANALENIYRAIELSNPSPEDIVVTLDGDDWLENDNVLTKLNATYNSNDCWLTYGSYIEYPSGNVGVFASEIPLEVHMDSSYRKFPWCTSHLRTFKHHLWARIDRDDLLDSEGNFYSMSGDLAIMFPMLEMSGRKSKYIDDPMYVYNLTNPINDHKVNHNNQINLENEIRNRKSYDEIK
jgi:hypothetical protein